MTNKIYKNHLFNNKGIIREHTLIIYPITFTVVVGCSEEQVNKYFTPKQPANWIAKPIEPALASTYIVQNKKTKNATILIWISTLNNCKGSVLCHECGHAALEIFNYIGATINPDEEQECFCYLLGNLFRFANITMYDYKELIQTDNRTKYDE